MVDNVVRREKLRRNEAVMVSGFDLEPDQAGIWGNARCKWVLVGFHCQCGAQPVCLAMAHHVSQPGLVAGIC